MSSTTAWVATTRPKTLVIAMSPILMGSVMAADVMLFSWPIFLCTIVTGLLLQIGTNFANDYYDHLKGSDRPERLGPIRPLQMGLIQPGDLKKAIFLAFGGALLLSSYLIYHGGPWIGFLALLAPIIGVWYTKGRFALAYLGVADIFVFVTLGPLGVMATYYLQTGVWSKVACVMGIAPGLIATAILAANNMRDCDEDKKSGKKTVPVRFGMKVAKVEYALCLTVAMLVPVILIKMTKSHQYSLLASLNLIPIISLVYELKKAKNGQDIVPIFVQTGQVFLLYTILFCLGWRL